MTASKNPCPAFPFVDAGVKTVEYPTKKSLSMVPTLVSSNITISNPFRYCRMAYSSFLLSLIPLTFHVRALRLRWLETPHAGAEELEGPAGTSGLCSASTPSLIRIISFPRRQVRLLPSFFRRVNSPRSRCRSACSFMLRNTWRSHHDTQVYRLKFYCLKYTHMHMRQGSEKPLDIVGLFSQPSGLAAISVG